MQCMSDLNSVYISIIYILNANYGKLLFMHTHTIYNIADIYEPNIRIFPRPSKSANESQIKEERRSERDTERKRSKTNVRAHFHVCL